MRSKLRLAVAMLAFGIAPALHAQRVVLDFADVECHSTLTSYQHAGYTLVPFSTNPFDRIFASYCPTDPLYYGGSAALFVGTGAPASVTMSSQSGHFGIESMRLSYRGASGTQNIGFYGRLQDGTEHFQQFVIPQSTPSIFTTVVFDDVFRDITSLQWSSTVGGNLQFDDITVYNTAPEPRTVALLLAGLVAVAAVQWRRTRAS